MAFNVVPKNDNYVLPTDYYKYTSPFAGEMNDKINGKTDLKETMKNTSRGGFSKGAGDQMNYFPASKTQNARPNLVETKKIMGR